MVGIRRKVREGRVVGGVMGGGMMLLSCLVQRLVCWAAVILRCRDVDVEMVRRGAEDKGESDERTD